MNESEVINNIYFIDIQDNNFFEMEENNILKSQNILKKWNETLVSSKIYYIEKENDFLLNRITLNSDTIKYLKYRRNGFKPRDDISTFLNKYNNTKTKRIEYGGYISSYNIIEDVYEQYGGAIENYIYRKNVINFHTHPPYDRKWAFNPPSHDDIVSIINMSIRDNYIYTGLIASFEGIYIYYLYPEFFKEIRSKFLDTGLSENFENIFIDLRKLLGYSKEINLKKKYKPKPAYNLSDFNDIKIGNLFGGNDRHKLLQYNNPEITINQFMETLNNMGICINLYNYESDNILVPINIVQEDSGKYMINYRTSLKPPVTI